MNTKLFVFIATILMSLPVMAQKFELGKVSVEELQQKQHPTDPDATAAVLFTKGEVSFDYNEQNGFTMTRRVKTRIKIYKKEGYDWANFEQTYYLPNESKETVSFSDAATFNLENGKIVKSKLKSDGEFDEKLNKYWGKKKITMPNVKEGSVIEYEYTISSGNITKLDDWDFQMSIPVNYSEFQTEFPEYFVYKINQRGYIFPKVTTQNSQKSYTINGKERTGGEGFSPVRTTFTQDKIDFEATKTTYLAENVPALKDEAFVNNIHNYVSGISHELSTIKYPNTPVKYLSTDWETVTKKIYDYDDFGPELNKTGYFEEDVNTLLAGITTPTEKIITLFDFVKKNIKWNGFYGYACNDGVKRAYKDRAGNVAEINLMLTAMLRHSGINANPVLLSTRSNGISFFPSRTAFNYVICAVEIKDGLILLDATDSYALPNVLPIRDLNWFGRLVRKEGSSNEVDLVPKMLSKESVNMMAKISDKGEVTGKLRKQLTDYNALVFRQRYSDMNNDSYLENLENKNNKIEISEYSRENDKELAKPIIETYAFKGSTVEIIGDKMYFTPMLFMSLDSNPFKQEKREYPVDFTFPTEDKYTVAIEIPSGYQVESIPASVSLATVEGFATFRYTIAHADGKIQLSVITDINSAIVAPDNYEMLKDFFQKMIDKQKEKIVLKKV
ncbi:MAG: transglutaminase [Flavobacterium sp. BFFFF1]|uniref:DUF3857 domain-containing protein n=1 Tax=Flavobacterium sp. BFFFF1 TaxID=2015557 RepID=UPI000BCC41DD|nr:transglutaminase domain-containing protein [Flavobacterium sp. BFFFF1]OYU79796.1 MAG: transglutaminase [Flavobacterium sp. BFFFF1]